MNWLKGRHWKRYLDKNKNKWQFNKGGYIYAN